MPLRTMSKPKAAPFTSSISGRRFRLAGVAALVTVLGFLVWHATLAAQTETGRISVLYTRIDGSINPAQEDLLKQSIQVCQADRHNILLIGLDTPGGLGQSMREMLKTILNAPVPVIT
mgnify:FL=1